MDFTPTEISSPILERESIFKTYWLIPLAIVILLCLVWFVRKRADRPLYTLQGHNNGNIVSLAFSPDGKVLASGTVGASDTDAGGTSWQGTEVQLWDTQNATLLHTLKGRSGELKCVTFSPNGRVLASGSNDAIETDSTAAASNREGQNQYMLRLWDVRTGALLRLIPGPKGLVHLLEFLPNRCLIALDSQDNKIGLGKTHEPGQLSHILQVQDTDTVNAVALSPDGQFIASSTWERKEVPIIHLWNARTGALQRTLRGHTDMVPTLAFSPDGRMLASGVAAQANNPSEIKIWDVLTGKLIATLNGNQAPVSSIVFSPDNKTLVNGSTDGTLKLWDVVTGQLKRTIKSGLEMDALTFTADGKTLAGGGADSTVKLWNIG